MDVRSIVKDILTRYASPEFKDRAGVFARFGARDREAGIDVLVNVLPRVIESSPRLQRELAQLSRDIRLLDHPYVTRILDVAQEQGVPYLVNAAVDETRRLSAQLTEEPVDLERAGQIINQIGKALEYAGHKKIPHGSLTPDQVILNEQGEATITGLGLASLAALLGARGGNENNVYLAPEQRLPDHAPTMRGDVYSLAAILFRMLTGMEPDLDVDSSVRVDQLNDQVPPAVGHVVARAMDPDPLKRPRSADDFVLGLLSAIRAPKVVKEALADGKDQRGTDEGPAWPDPLPFPEQADIPLTDLSTLYAIAQEAQDMLTRASKLIEMPAYKESLELSDEDDDLPNFDVSDWR